MSPSLLDLLGRFEVSIINNKTHFDRVLSAFDTAIMGFFQRNASDSWFHRFRQACR